MLFASKVPKTWKYVFSDWSQNNRDFIAQFFKIQESWCKKLLDFHALCADWVFYSWYVLPNPPCQTPYWNITTNKTKTLIHLFHLPRTLNLETKGTSLFSFHFGKLNNPNLFLSFQNLSTSFSSNFKNLKNPNLLLSFRKTKIQHWRRLLSHPLKTRNLR